MTEDEFKYGPQPVPYIPPEELSIDLGGGFDMELTKLPMGAIRIDVKAQEKVFFAGLDYAITLDREQRLWLAKKLMGVDPC